MSSCSYADGLSDLVGPPATSYMRFAKLTDIEHCSTNSLSLRLSMYGSRFALCEVRSQCLHDVPFEAGFFPKSFRPARGSKRHPNFCWTTHGEAFCICSLHSEITCATFLGYSGLMATAHSQTWFLVCASGLRGHSKRSLLYRSLFWWFSSETFSFWCLVIHALIILHVNSCVDWFFFVVYEASHCGQYR